MVEGIQQKGDLSDASIGRNVYLPPIPEANHQYISRLISGEKKGLHSLLWDFVVHQEQPT